MLLLWLLLPLPLLLLLLLSLLLLLLLAQAQHLLQPFKQLLAPAQRSLACCAAAAAAAMTAAVAGLTMPVMPSSNSLRLRRQQQGLTRLVQLRKQRLNLIPVLNHSSSNSSWQCSACLCCAASRRTNACCFASWTSCCWDALPLQL